jgi:hypothetical protein
MRALLAVAVVLALCACESRVIVLRTPTPQTGGPTASGSPSATATASPSPTKIVLRQLGPQSAASRLVSYERGGDVGPSTLRFVLTDDGRVVTAEAGGDLVQRKMTPSGAANLLLQALQTGYFAKDTSYLREPVPGTTPPAHGTTVFILVVANAGREVRVIVEPTGQPDDEQYQRSVPREKLTALARGYEDLSWVPANLWIDRTPQPYQPTYHRLFVLPQPNVAPGPLGADVESVWPFLTPIENAGETITGGSSGTAWRCAILVNDDALALGDALTRAGLVARYAAGTPMAIAALAWRGGTSTVRLQLSPLLPHEINTCAGAVPPA